MREWRTHGGSVKAKFMYEGFSGSIDDRDVELARALVRGGCCVEAGGSQTILKP